MSLAKPTRVPSEIKRHLKQVSPLAPPDRSRFPQTLQGYKDYVEAWEYYRSKLIDIKMTYARAREFVANHGRAQPKAPKVSHTPEEIESRASARKARKKAKEKLRKERRRLESVLRAGKLAVATAKVAEANAKILRSTTRLIPKGSETKVKQKEYIGKDEDGRARYKNVLKKAIVDTPTPVDYSGGWSVVGPRGRILREGERMDMVKMFYGNRLATGKFGSMLNELDNVLANPPPATVARSSKTITSKVPKRRSPSPY